jgi:hypothetical protein
MARIILGSVPASDSERPGFDSDVNAVAAEWAAPPVARARTVAATAATHTAIAAETRVLFVVMDLSLADRRDVDF